MRSWPKWRDPAAVARDLALQPRSRVEFDGPGPGAPVPRHRGERGGSAGAQTGCGGGTRSCARHCRRRSTGWASAGTPAHRRDGGGKPRAGALTRRGWRATPNAGEALVARIDAALARARRAGGIAPVSRRWSGNRAGSCRADTLIADLLARTGFSLAAPRRAWGRQTTCRWKRHACRSAAVIFAAGAHEERTGCWPTPRSRGLRDTRAARFDPGAAVVRRADHPARGERLAEARRAQ
jgi:hypothetical protein